MYFKNFLLLIYRKIHNDHTAKLAQESLSSAIIFPVSECFFQPYFHFSSKSHTIFVRGLSTFTVCVKRIASDISWCAVKSDAAVLCALNNGDITPHCFGVCLNLHSIVMAYINVDDQPVTMHFCKSKFRTSCCPMNNVPIS